MPMDIYKNWLHTGPQRKSLSLTTMPERRGNILLKKAYPATSALYVWKR